MQPAIATQRAASSGKSVFFRNSMHSRERLLPMAFGSLHGKRIGLNSISNAWYTYTTSRRTFCRSSTSADKNEVLGADQAARGKRKKKKNSKNSKDKRREFIGKAKAVDRGQWAAVYSPGGDDHNSFTAKSGLPDRSKPFTVLGIESSCDDTGGAFHRLCDLFTMTFLNVQNQYQCAFSLKIKT